MAWEVGSLIPSDAISEITPFDPLSVGFGVKGAYPFENSSVVTYFVVAYGFVDFL